jgi:hypothetical protein
MQRNARQIERTPRTPSELQILGMLADNAERISALLTFPPMMLARDADAARANAAQLQIANDILRGMLPA